MSYTISVQIKVKEGDPCLAQNYRSVHKPWEPGKVHRVKVGIRDNLFYQVSYEVLLDRTTTGKSRMFPDGGAPIFLTVGDERIKAVR
jgi:hypothetical protein